MKRISKHTFTSVAYGLLYVLLYACNDDPYYSPPFPTDPTANFTYTTDKDNPQQVTFTSIAARAVAYEWDFGDGSSSQDQFPVHIYSEAGEYTVLLTAIGDEGTTPADTAKTITVEAKPPAYEPGMINLGESGWTVTDVDPGQTVDFVGNSFVIQGPGIDGRNQNTLVWQTLNVEAGKSYKFNAFLKESGSNNHWAQVYFGTSKPDDPVVDYDDNRVYGLNTWSGCGGEPVDDSILKLNCDSPGPADGVFTFDTTQTIYIVFKTGSAGASAVDVTWYDISFMEVQ